jgi:hypothetical protein
MRDPAAIRRDLGAVDALPFEFENRRDTLIRAERQSPQAELRRRPLFEHTSRPSGDAVNG